MSETMCEVQVQGVGEDRIGYDFLILQDEAGRQLPIWIGKCEAFAIHFKMQTSPAPRPMTHDLIAASVTKLGGRWTRLLIDDLWQDAFYAKLCLEVETEGEVQIDCRPADGIAIAMAAGVPIYVRDDVLEEAKIAEFPDLADDDPSDGLDPPET